MEHRHSRDYNRWVKSNLRSWGPFLVVALAVMAWWRPSPMRAHEAEESPALDASADESQLTNLLVDFRDDVPAAVLANNGLIEEPLSQSSYTDRLYRVRFPTHANAAAVRARLAQDRWVENVDWDAPAQLFDDEAEAAAPQRAIPSAPECALPSQAAHAGFPNDPCFSLQWHLRQVGLPGAWRIGQGSGAIVAVIDTGVTPVPDLPASLLVPGYNFVADNNNANDDHGHGTHVAGTIAQATHNGVGVAGVAFGARIMPVKVLSAQGSGSMGAIAQAIRWAADHGAQVINMSLGGPFPVNVIKSAVAYAHEKGVVVVAAAGNDGRGKVSYPARYPGVLAVAATQFDETTTFYSNWGPEIDIAAPGGNVRVDQNGDGKPDGVLQNTVVPGNTARTDYLFFMGTSMASPHVAGAAALLVGAGVNRPDALEDLLLRTARRPQAQSAAINPLRSAAAHDDRYGAGIVDVGAALTKAQSGKAGGPLALGGTLAWALLSTTRRRRRLGSSGRFGMGFGVVAGAALLFVPFAQGTPLVLSALLPLGALGLGFGVRRFRTPLAGFALGCAGALLFSAIARTTSISLVPDSLETLWLLANAAAASFAGASSLREA